MPDAGDTEITPTEDGGVEINFEPGAFSQEQGESHFDNLTELLPDDIKSSWFRISTKLYELQNFRKDWEDTYAKGLDLLGFKYEQKTEPFQGASGATHPVLAEAVTISSIGI